MIDTYHADYSRDSHSSLEMFRRSVEEYAAVRIHRTMMPPEPTPAMLFGSAFHAFVLEPERFHRVYLVPPNFDRRTKSGREAAAAWETKTAGNILITLDDLELMQRMRSALYRNCFAASAIGADGVVETPVEWECEETGLALKCRPDKILPAGLIIDLKTTNEIDLELFRTPEVPEPNETPIRESRTVANFGYHRQAALYLSGLSRRGITGPFMFIAVSKRPPHEVACYVLDSRSLEKGREQNRATLIELAERKLKDDWTSRWNSRIETVSLPRWALQN